MPIAAIAAPVIAIGATAASAATVGITAAATIFSAIGAVGAVVGAVGHFTGVKELSIAGSILGGIGAVGGFASGMGIFGANGGSLFGSNPVASPWATEAAAGAAPWATEAGSFASNVTPMAGGDVVATAAPPGGYTMETLANSGTAGGLAGYGEAGGAGMSNVDIIKMVRGLGDSNFNPLEPAKQLADAQVVAPAAEVLPNTTVAAAPQEAVQPQVAQEFTPDPGLAKTEPSGLIDSTQPPGVANKPALDPVLDPNYVPRDQYGNVIAQGDGTGTPIGNVRNPPQPGDPGAAVQPEPRVTAVEPPAATPTPADAATTPAPKITGGVSAEANISGFPAGGGPQGPRGGATAPTPGVASPTATDQSIWSRIFDMIESKPTLSLGAIKAASSFISGAFSEGTTPEQRRAYAAQAEQNLAAANLARAQEAILQRRLRNMNDPIPMATSNSPPGLINSTSPVTGRPA